jgi:DNA-binding NarL/FixJ family response regulator
MQKENNDIRQNGIPPIRVFLADDNVDFLHSLTRYLESDSRISIVGEAHSGREAVAMIPEIAPDLVLMDIKMPEMNGFEATRQLKKMNPQLKIVMLTLYDTAEYRWEARNVCADGFIEKSQLNSHLNEIVTYLMQQQNEDTIVRTTGHFIE